MYIEFILIISCLINCTRIQHEYNILNEWKNENFYSESKKEFWVKKKFAESKENLCHFKERENEPLILIVCASRVKHLPRGLISQKPQGCHLLEKIGKRLFFCWWIVNGLMHIEIKKIYHCSWECYFQLFFVFSTDIVNSSEKVVWNHDELFTFIDLTILLAEEQNIFNVNLYNISKKSMRMCTFFSKKKKMSIHNFEDYIVSLVTFHAQPFHRELKLIFCHVYIE